MCSLWRLCLAISRVWRYLVCVVFYDYHITCLFQCMHIIGFGAAPMPPSRPCRGSSTTTPPSFISSQFTTNTCFEFCFNDCCVAVGVRIARDSRPAAAVAWATPASSPASVNSRYAITFINNIRLQSCIRCDVLFIAYWLSVMLQLLRESRWARCRGRVSSTGSVHVAKVARSCVKVCDCFLCWSHVDTNHGYAVWSIQIVHAFISTFVKLLYLCETYMLQVSLYEPPATPEGITPPPKKHTADHHHHHQMKTIIYLLLWFTYWLMFVVVVACTYSSQMFVDKTCVEKLC